MKYEETIVDENKARIISRLYFQVDEGIIRKVSKRKEYSDGEVSNLCYMVTNSYYPESENLQDCINKTWDYIENLIKPETTAGYIDEEENIYYGSLRNKDLSIFINAELDLHYISVVINKPTDVNEERFDKIAIDISRKLYDSYITK